MDIEQRNSQRMSFSTGYETLLSTHTQYEHWFLLKQINGCVDYKRGSGLG